MERKYLYMISDEPDEVLFKKICSLIEKKPEMWEVELLEDVDGSLYKKYHHAMGNLEVCNAYYFDNEVRIDSDFELEPYLGDKWFIRKIVRSDSP